MKAAIVTFLFLAACAFAARLSCSATYAGRNAFGEQNIERKLCGTITDEKGDAVIAGIGEWSGGRFTARWSEGRRVRMARILTVVNVEEAANQPDASSEVQEMEHLIRSHS